MRQPLATIARIETLMSGLLTTAKPVRIEPMARSTRLRSSRSIKPEAVGVWTIQSGIFLEGR
jgi:hypothetical protein